MGVGAWAAFTTITWGCAGDWTTFHSAGRQHISREASVITVNLVARQITSSATSALMTSHDAQPKSSYVLQ